MAAPRLLSAQAHAPFPADRFLPYLTTADIAALPKERAAVALNVCAVEQHGPHLPVATDLILGVSILSLALERLERSVQLWVIPPLAYGRSNEHAKFAGTMTLSQSTLATVIGDIAKSVSRTGFRRLILFNSHGGNLPILDYLARDIREDTGLMVFPISMFRLELDYPQVSQEEARWGTHAGEWETSMMLALAPELVHMDRTRDIGGHARFRAATEHLTLTGPMHFAWLTEDVTMSGAIGDPRPAVRERGEDIVELTVAKAARVLEEICAFEMPVPAGETD
jgi:creatinine amidohydrolase